MIRKGNIPAEEYYNAEGFVNYSLLKHVSESGNLGLQEPEIKFRTRKAFTIGDIVETYLLESEDLSYIRLDNTAIISGQAVELFNYLLSYCKERNIMDANEISDSDMLDIVSQLGLWRNFKNPELILSNCRSAIEKASFYLSLDDNTTVTDSSTFSLIEDIKEGLTTFEHVKDYYTPKDGEEWYNQYTIMEDENFEVPTKVRIDRLIINHETKSIKIIDVKTTQNKSDQFLKAFYQFKYYYQLPYYTRIFLLTHPEYAEYTVEMSFLVISKATPKIPVIYILPNTFIDIVWGDTSKRFKCINTLMEEVKWYWDYGTTIPYEVAVNDNIMVINNLWLDSNE